MLKKKVGTENMNYVFLDGYSNIIEFNLTYRLLWIF